MRADVSEAIAEEELQNAIALGIFDGAFRLEGWKYPTLIVDVASVKRPLRFRLRFDFTDYYEHALQLRLLDDQGVETFDPFPQRNGGGFPNHVPAGLPQFFVSRARATTTRIRGTFQDLAAKVGKVIAPLNQRTS